MSDIHSTAIIEDGAFLGEGVKIGPYAHVGQNVRLGAGVELKSHAVVAGDTHLGDGCVVFPFASIGHQAQDLKYKGEKAIVRIGEKCTFREGVTVNAGTEGGGGSTTIGNNCAFLANSHVGHDSHLGNGIVLSNNVMIAGHVEVADGVIFGGGSAVIQFTRIGTGAFIGGLAGLENDLIPFGMVTGNRASLGGLNLVGLKRRGIPRDQIHALRSAYKELFESDEGTLRSRAEAIAAHSDDQPMVKVITDFILEKENRRFCTPPIGE
ncbi:acyl-(acyl-carrier-protein)-UDP-N-acetylglucosamine O-acyltransferase [Roseibium sp. TrichSKD4]|uniref:acyl-ACP--UDP-N-acetylglucosamine O-acyltransferase n=1 Tax=Roseibium sp. TrichSKD4 TaxID=744980 RepID=UPI0001E56736|nr:acyl-ACP--UDP-N-acetylglucosamine O-acyltransferase [Roseibium sp. TrichSKD4]EFO33649.1 acyl-(acyl-carrier-protein)-UDP-N-acetylglucosamine O-acyltransferase [Roseibium sp. TrichSKD4]